MAGFKCPYCGDTFSLNQDLTHFTSWCRFGSGNRFSDEESVVVLEYCKCPSCGKYSIFAEGRSESVKFPKTPLKPNSLAQQFPDYIPLQIRNDYEEACAIVNLSPKSSATLARRCLQGMIRDFWQISGKKNLYQETEAIKTLVSPSQWKAIDGIRRIGNIGAHMEQDVNQIIDIEPDEATKLIQLIEILIKQWYINRHETEELYNEVVQISTDKQNQK